MIRRLDVFRYIEPVPISQNTITMLFLSKICIIFLLLTVFPPLSFATTDYAQQTGLQCDRCHTEPTGGGRLTSAGETFKNDMVAKGRIRTLTKAQRVVRFFVGYIHMVMAIAWFGTILYVHILLKPAYAAGGLPKGELFLGWFSIIVLSITGALLSIAKIPSFEVLYTTRFGILLSVKVFLFLMMVSTALIVTFYIGPRLKRKWRAKWEAEVCEVKHGLTPEELRGFDGKEGRPAYIAYKGNIHDVTNSKLWKDGSHVKKHLAGHDLTNVIKTAPHGEEKIMSMPQVGKLIETGRVPVPFPERTFYILAYTNLVFVFSIIFIIALWRWL